jgi:hypothetical protein
MGTHTEPTRGCSAVGAVRTEKCEEEDDLGDDDEVVEGAPHRVEGNDRDVCDDLVHADRGRDAPALMAAAAKSEHTGKRE